MSGALFALTAAAFAPASPVWEVDLAASDGGLVSGGQTGQWEWGQPSFGPVGLGACWGTNLDGLHLNDTVDWIEVQLPDLAGIAEPTLVVRHWYAIAAGDTGVLEIDDGSGFLPIEPVYGYPEPEGYVGRSNGYVDAVVDLRGRTGAPRLRLTLVSDASFADVGWYVQHLALYDGDVVAPRITPIVVPGDTQDIGGSHPLELDIVDDRAVTSATVWFEVGADEVALPMTPGAGSRWSAVLPGQPPDTLVSYRVEATDGVNVGRWPNDGQAAFRVFLAAPTDLRGPASAHLVANEVDLTWTAPESPHGVLGYRVHRELAITLAAEVTGTTARVTVADPQRYWVEAVYAEGVGDPSDVLQLEVEVPRLLEVRPEVAFQGQQLYVRLVGSSLYLLGGTSTLDLGPDVRIVDLDVFDVNSATARVEIAPDAAVGPVAVSLRGTPGLFDFPDRFRIRDGADAPHISRITPAEVHQGERLTVEIEATVPFAAVPAISADEDLVFTSDVAVDGAIARFGLAVSGRARLGLHSLVVDDGDRLYTVDLQVEETVVPLPTGCQGCGGGGPVPLGGLLMAIWAGLFTPRRGWRTAPPTRRGPPATAR